ncbi:hypothetical protein WJX79_009654 [Trebouxia sp. C0005]
MMSPLRGGEGGVSTGVGNHWQQGPANRAPSPSGNISWGRLGAGDHMFSLPITPTAHLGQRAFAPPGHGSRLSHVSRADSMGYAARHSMLESQHTMGKTTSSMGNTTNAFSRSGRHSTPVPSHTTVSRNTGRKSSKANWHSSEAGVSVSFEAAGSFAETKSHAHGSMTHVSVDASSSVGVSAPSSMMGNESSFRSSSSSSQESESQGSVPPQLRIISLDEESGRIISAESPRGSARVLAWHPSSAGGGGADDHSVTSEMSATSTVSRGSRSSFSVKPLKVPDSAFHEPGIAGSPRIDAWSPRTGSRGGFGPAAPHRFTSPSPDGSSPLAKASPRARNSDLGTTRSRLARGQSSGYAVRRGSSELHPRS